MRHKTSHESRLVVVTLGSGERRTWRARGYSWFGQLSWTADSRTLAFVDASHGKWRLRALDLSRPGASPASSPVLFSSPVGRINFLCVVISPDGRRVYATINEPGGDSASAKRLIVAFSATDGTRERVVYRADRRTEWNWRMLEMNANGTHFLAMRGDTLGRLDIASGTFTELPKASGDSWARAAW